jgi:hypothetical protein
MIRIIVGRLAEEMVVLIGNAVNAETAHFWYPSLYHSHRMVPDVFEEEENDPRIPASITIDFGDFDHCCK